MKIWAHTLVKNEERYLWFSVMSVIDYVDKMLLWDTGSTDNTLTIIKILQKKYQDKIIFKEVGNVGIEDFTAVRQQMLNETQGDWFIIVDGDEIWWNDSISKVRNIIDSEGVKIESLVSQYKNLVGDIFHYQPENAGKYSIDDNTGHLTIRAVSLSIKGLNFSRPHGQQGLFDGDGKLIQDRDKQKRVLIKGDSFMHFTHLIRSRNLATDREIIKRALKYKYELGLAFDKDYYYPESLLKTYPDLLSSPWESANSTYFIKAAVQTPLKIIKRRLVKGKSGY